MDWGIVSALVGAVLLIPTAYAGIIGAPWAPTRMPSVKKAFDNIGISEKDLVVDLGAGNGSILREAARRGANVYGYELSPIMWIISAMRTGWRTAYGNFFKKRLPKDTTLVFCFLMPKHMNTVGKYIASQQLPRKALVLSYAFPFPELQAIHIYREKKCAPLYLYEMRSIYEHFEPSSTSG